MGAAVELSGDADFEREVRSAPQPVLVDFWANWCGTCLLLAPVFDRLAQEHGEKLRFAKVDVERDPETARLHGVSSLPTLILFEGGEPKVRLSGAKSRKQIIDAFAAYL